MTTELIPTLDEDLKTLHEAFNSGRPIPPEVDARLEERAAAFRERILQQHGPLDIAVSYLRQERGATTT